MQTTRAPPVHRKRDERLSDRQPPIACPRCGAVCEGPAWCQKCGLNLRMPFDPSGAADAAPPPVPVPGTVLTSAWDRLATVVDPMLLTGGAVLVAVLALIAVVVLATSGGSGGSPAPLLPTANSVVTTTASTAVTESGSTAGEVA
jgi:hypothetical protein